MTEMLNRPSSAKRANAPAVGTHLPTRNDAIAVTMVTQTKTSATTYVAGVLRLPLEVKKPLPAPRQGAGSAPPIHTGLVTQYRKLFTAPARRPKASLVQKY